MSETVTQAGQGAIPTGAAVRPAARGGVPPSCFDKLSMRASP